MRRTVLVMWWLLSAVITMSCARELTAWFLTLPFNMPYCVDMAIRFGFKVFANDSTPAPEDMGDVALLFYFVVATVLTGVIVATVATLMWRHVLSPRLDKGD